MTIHIKPNTQTVTGLLRLKAPMAEGALKVFKPMADLVLDRRCSRVLSPHSGLVTLCGDKLSFHLRMLNIRTASAVPR